jgi:lincosamide nucleotidyltransferase A/C/D/E
MEPGFATGQGGGSGVAALAGRQTREHRDLDLAVDAGDLDTACRVLGQVGYTANTDWLPARIGGRRQAPAGSTCTQ